MILCKIRGGGQEDQPHIQGAVAAWAQEGLEELSHVEGQEGKYKINLYVGFNTEIWEFQT